jgi:hypothetical protein
MSHPPALPLRARAAATNRPLPPLPKAPAITASVHAPVSEKPKSALSSPTWSTSTDTALLTLPPGFIEALRKVVPKRRRAKVPYVVGVGLLAVVGILAADASTRDYLAASWHREAPSASPGLAVAPDVKPAASVRIPAAVATSDPAVDHPAGPAASPAGTPSAAPNMQKKPRPHRLPKTAGKTQGT